MNFRLMEFSVIFYYRFPWMLVSIHILTVGARTSLRILSSFVKTEVTAGKQIVKSEGS